MAAVYGVVSKAIIPLYLRRSFRGKGDDGDVI